LSATTAAGVQRAVAFALAAPTPSRSPRLERRTVGNAPNSTENRVWERAEPDGKQRRTECPREEGPRRVQFGGEGRREPPLPKRLLERRSVNRIGALN